MPKTVLIDARWLIGGIGTYTENLLMGLGREGNGLRFHAITRGADAPRVKQWCPSVTVVDVPIYTLLEQFMVPRAAKKCDLLHVPHYNAPLLHRGPLVVSIMDLIHLSEPPYRRRLSSFLYARPMLHAASRKALHIVTVSEYSKLQIMETLRIPSSKISVIHCGVNNQFFNADDKEPLRTVKEHFRISQPYLLYVGNLKPHKNVATLLRAFAQLRRQKRIPHRLLIVGDDARWKRSLLDECSRLGISNDTTFIPYVSPALLPKIYAAADLLVMPSSVEGFGLPVLEAMACGTPVVCSRAASLPEVAGPAAVYFEPASEEQLAIEIERLLRCPELCEALRVRGIDRARQFTWQSSTRKHIELYNRLLGQNSGKASGGG